MKTGIYFIITFGLVLLTAIVLNGVMHEETHKAIFDFYGIESHIEYFGNGLNFVTIADYNTVQEKCTEECRLAQHINEIVSYNLQGLTFIIGAGLLFIIVLLTIIIQILYEFLKRMQDLNYDGSV